MLRYQDMKAKAYRVLDLTSLAVEKFDQLVSAFKTAFVARMQQWTMEGKPRRNRTYTPYANSPLPTPEDRLLFILSYLKVAALQVAHGSLFGMSQSNANKWIHVLLPVLEQTLQPLGDAPSRDMAALAARLAARPTPTDGASAPLFTMMAPTARSLAPKTRLNKPRIIAVRKSGIR